MSSTSTGREADAVPLAGVRTDTPAHPFIRSSAKPNQYIAAFKGSSRWALNNWKALAELASTKNSAGSILQENPKGITNQTWQLTKHIATKLIEDRHRLRKQNKKQSEWHPVTHTIEESLKLLLSLHDSARVFKYLDENQKVKESAAVSVPWVSEIEKLQKDIEAVKKPENASVAPRKQSCDSEGGAYGDARKRRLSLSERSVGEPNPKKIQDAGQDGTGRNKNSDDDRDAVVSKRMLDFRQIYLKGIRTGNRTARIPSWRKKDPRNPLVSELVKGLVNVVMTSPGRVAQPPTDYNDCTPSQHRCYWPVTESHVRCLSRQLKAALCESELNGEELSEEAKEEKRLAVGHLYDMIELCMSYAYDSMNDTDTLETIMDVLEEAQKHKQYLTLSQSTRLFESTKNDDFAALFSKKVELARDMARRLPGEDAYRQLRKTVKHFDAAQHESMKLCLEKIILREQCSDERRKDYEELLAELNAAVRQSIPGARFEPFGSYIQGPLAYNSDLDLSFCKGTPSEWEMGKDAQIALLGSLKTIVCSIEHMKQVNTITTPRVPILQGRHDKKRITFDISIENSIAAKNTELLRAYISIDSRVADLIFLVRLWARRQEIIGNRHNQLSSYAFVNMVVHYLQNTSPPVLPCLQDPKHTSQIEKDTVMAGGVELDCTFVRDPSTIMKKMKKNVEGLPELLRGFFLFYAKHCAGNQAISIRTAGFVPIPVDDTKHHQSLNGKGIIWGIEDPFQTNLDLCRFVHSSLKKVCVLHQRLAAAAEAMNSGEINDLFSHKEVSGK